MNLTIGQLALIRALNRRGVRYLVVGGFAACFHGHKRQTTDLDLFIGHDEANVAAAVEALSDADPGGGRRVALKPDPSKRQQFRSDLIGGGVGYHVDFLTGVADLDFDACYTKRHRAIADDTHAFVMDLADLIVSKQNGERDSDRDDYRALTAIANSRAT